MTQETDHQTPETKAVHDARWQRIMDCVHLKQPDRMPTALFCAFWLAKLGLPRPASEGNN